MSVIVAVKHNGAVYMGADSQTTYSNDVKKNSIIESERKIIKLENGILVGGTAKLKFAICSIILCPQCLKNCLISADWTKRVKCKATL